MTENPIHADIDPNRVFVKNCIKFLQYRAAEGDAMANEVLHSYTLFSAVTEYENLDKLIESQLVFRDEKEPKLTTFVEQVRRFNHFTYGDVYDEFHHGYGKSGRFLQLQQDINDACNRIAVPFVDTEEVERWMRGEYDGMPGEALAVAAE